MDFFKKTGVSDECLGDLLIRKSTFSGKRRDKGISGKEKREFLASRLIVNAVIGRNGFVENRQFARVALDRRYDSVRIFDMGDLAVLTRYNPVMGRQPGAECGRVSVSLPLIGE